MNYDIDPLATITNRKMDLYINELPARLGRNNKVVDIYLYHESVSREHCEFECIDHNFIVRDLNSTFGTYINGEMLEPNVRYRIEDGAQIQFGKVKMVFNANYRALSEWERRQEQLAAEPEHIPDERESVLPADGKNTSVSIREISRNEYDEDEVVYIECGLKPQEGFDNIAGAKPGKVLRLTWVDDSQVETKSLRIDHFPFSIGRKSDENDYAIAGKGISRKHMRFEEADGEIFVYDDASTNGVRLNGERITPETKVKLNSGDNIRISGVTFVVKID